MSTCTVSLFPGQGCQFIGMGEQLFERFPYHVQKASSVLGYSLEALCKGEGSDLHNTEFTQPALFCVNSLQYLDSLAEQDLQSDYFLGHSLGELSALFAAGGFSFETGVAIAQARGRLMAGCKGGTMAAVVGLSLDTLEKLIANSQVSALTIANYNSPKQFVVAGSVDDIEQFEEEVVQAGGRYIRLDVSGAFHTERMQQAAEQFRQFLNSQTFYPLKRNVVSNVTAKCYLQDDREALIEMLVRQLYSPVQWMQSVCALPQDTELMLHEFGPKPVVKKLAIEILDNHSLA